LSIAAALSNDVLLHIALHSNAFPDSFAYFDDLALSTGCIFDFFDSLNLLILDWTQQFEAFDANAT